MDEGQRRWRLVLGRYARDRFDELEGQDAAMDQSLDFLYAREYAKRGIGEDRGPGSSERTRMDAVTWLDAARRLFPKEVFETLQSHALDRYGITDILEDPEALARLEPSTELLKVLLTFKGRANPAVKEKLRLIADRVIRDLTDRLRMEVQRAFSGRRNRFRRSSIASAANFDWRATMRDNLKTWDADRGRLVAERLRFNARERRRLPWRVVLCVDQSGSMMGSVIHSAVMAAILCGLPGIQVKMVLFDTAVLDVSDHLTDPLETLLSVQLGGGTDIGKAVGYCERLVEVPERTIFVLISDFAEGGSPSGLLAALKRMADQRIRMIGLTALDDDGNAWVDEGVAGRAASLGMKVGAMTPDRFAHWLAGVVQ